MKTSVLLASSWTTQNVLLSIAIILIALVLIAVVSVAVSAKLYAKGSDIKVDSAQKTDNSVKTNSSIGCEDSLETVQTRHNGAPVSAKDNTACISEDERNAIYSEVFHLSKPCPTDENSKFAQEESEISAPCEHLSTVIGEEAPVKAISADERNAIFNSVFGIDKLQEAPIYGNICEEADELTDNAEQSEDDVVGATVSVLDEVALSSGIIEDEENSGRGKIIFAGREFKVRYVKSFTAKLCQSNDVLKERYSALKNELLSYKKAKARMSWHFETFRLGRPVIAKFSITGKTLSLYLALDPKEFVGTKYNFKDVSEVKKYQAVPMRLKIKSNRSVRWAKELIGKMAEINGFKRFDAEEVDYYPEYLSTQELIAQKLIKVINAGDEAMTTNDFEDRNEPACADNLNVHAEGAPFAVIDEVYLDDDALPYDVVGEVSEDVKSEVAVTAQTSADEDFDKTTVNAQVFEQATDADTPAVNHSDDETDEKPVALAERDFDVVKEVTVSKAENVMTDEQAESLIETAEDDKFKLVKGDKKAIVNIDTLSRFYKNGETVNIASLIDKNIVSKRTGYVKILGRGVLNKALIVEANDFTMNAVKMILLTGGRVIEIEK